MTRDTRQDPWIRTVCPCSVRCEVAKAKRVGRNIHKKMPRHQIIWISSATGRPVVGSPNSPFVPRTIPFSSQHSQLRAPPRREMAPSRDESSSATGRSPALQRRPPSASRGIAGEVLAAERAAVLASLGGGRRTSSSTPRAPPAVSASVLRAALTSSARKSGLRNGGSVNASPTSVAATPPSRSSDAVMSADLWAMAHTPPPTEARRTLGYHPLGPTREEPATAPPTEAATDARRRVAALSEAAAAAVEDGLRRLASARRATGGVEEGTSKRTEGEGFMAREFTSMLDDIASGAESVSGDGDEGDRADGTKSSSVEDAGTDQEKPAE